MTPLGRTRSAAVAAGDVLDGLVLRYTFDNADVAGSTILDTSGNGLDGTKSADVLTGAPGVVNEAVEFSAQENYIRAANSASYKGLSAFTMSLWLNSDWSDGQVRIAVVGRFTNSGWGLGLDLPGGRKFRFHADGGGGRLDSPTGSPATSAWQHVLWRVGGGSQDVWLDGVQSASASFSGSMGGSSEELNLGRDGDRWWSSNEYIGLMDDFRIYNRRVTDAEVAVIYAQGTT